MESWWYWATAPYVLAIFVMFLIFPELTSIDELVQNDQERLWKIHFLDFLTSEFLVQWIGDKMQKLKLLKTVPSLGSSAQGEWRNDLESFCYLPNQREMRQRLKIWRCEIWNSHLCGIWRWDLKIWRFEIWNSHLCARSSSSKLKMRDLKFPPLCPL